MQRYAVEIYFLGEDFDAKNLGPGKPANMPPDQAGYVSVPHTVMQIAFSDRD